MTTISSCLAAIALAASVAAASPAQGQEVTPSSKTRILISADTANEVDDLYALVRALIEPSWDVVGVCSAQWQVSHYATPNTLEDSQRLNEVLLSLLERNRVPHPRGAAIRMYDWGQDVAQHSAAAYHIIREAHKTPPGQKLTVMMLGANTDLASALKIDPTIIPKLRVYLLGTSFDFETRRWRKRDFNCVMDVQAIEVVLDAKGLETHIMPVNVAAALVFEMAEVKAKFSGRNDLLDLLHRRWVDHVDGSRLQRTIWDLAVVSCMLRPQLCEQTEVMTPPENTPREVSVYSRIDGRRIREEFFDAVATHYRLDLDSSREPD